MNDVPTLDIRRRAEWRAWLRENHATSPGVWLVFHKNHTGVESIPYEDSVREALCFGWIDGLIKRLDEERYARRFSPRKPGSRWSDINRRRWTELKAAALLAPPGLAAAPTNNTYAPRPVVPSLPVYIGRALKASSRACPSGRSSRRRPVSRSRRSIPISHAPRRSPQAATSCIGVAGGRRASSMSTVKCRGDC